MLTISRSKYFGEFKLSKNSILPISSSVEFGKKIKKKKENPKQRLAFSGVYQRKRDVGRRLSYRHEYSAPSTAGEKSITTK